jgi:hypothetical protein
MPKDKHYSIVSLRFNDHSESQSFIIYEPDISKAQRIAEGWAAERYPDMVAEINVNAAPASSTLAHLLIERGLIIPVE